MKPPTSPKQRTNTDKPTGFSSDAAKRADSVLYLIKGGLDFAEAAKKFSEDAYAQYGDFPAITLRDNRIFEIGLRTRFPEEVENGFCKRAHKW